VPALADDWETCAKAAGDEAIAACTRAIKSGTYNGKTLALAYSNRGVEWRAKGDLARAIADYDEAIKADPQQPAAYNNRGIAYAAAADYDRAIADYDKAIELNPTYASALNNRGLAYFNNGQKERAIADYDAAIKLEPDAVRLNNRGNAYASRAQYDRAIQDFDAAVNLDAQYAIAVYNRGNAHFAKGDADRAIANYDQALALNPKYEDALVNRGVAHEKKGALDRAIADYEEAIKLEPKDAVAYNNRGNALLKKGDYDRAIADYDRAIKLDGKYVAAYFSRAIAHEGKKRFDEAPGRQAAAAECRGLEQPVLDPRDHRPPAGRARRLQRGAEAEARLHQRARQPWFRAAAHGPACRGDRGLRSGAGDRAEQGVLAVWARHGQAPQGRLLERQHRHRGCEGPQAHRHHRVFTLRPAAAADRCGALGFSDRRSGVRPRPQARLMACAQRRSDDRIVAEPATRRIR
jgi:tetratricopeptide (TPR) repeat protein